MIKLNELMGKKVRLVDCDDEVWVGIVYDFESKTDNDTDEDAIDLKIPGRDGVVEFTEKEIKGITII